MLFLLDQLELLEKGWYHSFELPDGSRIEGDDVSLGTTFLRGRTAHGTVDVPWQHIETVLFKR